MGAFLAVIRLTSMALCPHSRRLGGLAWQSFAGAGLAGGSAGLQAAGMRTTRGMERQLAALLGLSTAAAAGANGASSSQQQSPPPQGRAGVRHSGRSARQLRNMSDIMALEAGDDGASAGEEDGADAGAAPDAAADAGAAPDAAAAGGSQAAGDGEEGHEQDGAPTGLLVCGFSRDGTHIVAGGNDCNVYVWEWGVQRPGQQQQAMPAQQRGGRRGSLGAASGTPKAAGGAKAPAAASVADGQGSAAAAAAAEQQAEPDRMQDAQQPPPPSEQQQQQHASPAASGRRRQASPRQAGTPNAAAASADAAEDAPWPAPVEVCQLKGHRNDVVLLQFSHDGERVATGSKDGSVRVSEEGRACSGSIHCGFLLSGRSVCSPCVSLLLWSFECRRYWPVQHDAPPCLPLCPPLVRCGAAPAAGAVGQPPGSRR